MKKNHNLIEKFTKKINDILEILYGKSIDVSLSEILLFFIVISIFVSLVLSINITINQVKLIDTISQISRLKLSINEFQNKFGRLPGDIKNTKLLNITYYDTDGNENGIIDFNYELKNNLKINHNKMLSKEHSNFWLHLYNNTMFSEETNNILPQIPLNKNRYLDLVSYKNKNYIFVGVEFDNENVIYNNNTLTPIDSYMIDKKIDNGLSDSGKIIDFLYDNKDSNNLKVNCSNLGYYNVIYNKKVCSLLIGLD